MATADTKLLLVGCGKMGGALLTRALSAQLASKIIVVDPAPAPGDLNKFVTWLGSSDKLDPAFVPDIVLIAIKPQNIASVLPAYARFQKCVFVSIAAGATLEKLQKILGAAQAIIRAMPNLPASIGKGISVAVANKNVSATQRTLTDVFLKTIGETAWVEDEALIDAVTALSGSGPGYVFALCEAMAAAGERLGLPAALAAKLARETIVGSGALLAQSTDSAEALRRAVTSPGGTTEAALNHLQAPGGLPDLMRKAMTSAAERAKALAK